MVFIIVIITTHKRIGYDYIILKNFFNIKFRLRTYEFYVSLYKGLLKKLLLLEFRLLCMFNFHKYRGNLF